MIRQVLDLQHKPDTGSTTNTFELLHFLKVWLSQHINETDKRFVAFVNQNSKLNDYPSWSKKVTTALKKMAWWKVW